MTFRRETFRMEKPVAANYVTPSGVMCVQVLVPDDVEHVALLQGLMAQLTNMDNWQGTEADRAQLSYLWEASYVLTDWSVCEVADYAQIDIFCINSELLSGAGTKTYNASATLPFGYSMSNTNNSGYGFEDFLYLKAGEYNYHGWASLITNGGNTVVAIVDGVSVIDTIIASVSQAGAFGTRVHHTGSFTIPADGLYRIVAANDGTGGGANRQMNWISHHIRRVP